MSPPNHDEKIQQLVDDFRKGYLTRRGFLAKAAAFGLTAAAAVGLLGVPRTQKSVVAQDSPPEVTSEKWEKGKGWGWVWGDDDELGNLNELSPELTLKALSKGRSTILASPTTVAATSSWGTARARSCPSAHRRACS